jgi:hypothetical protein
MANLVNYGGFDFSSVSEGVDPFVGVSDEQVLVGGKFKTLKRITVQGRIIPTNFCTNPQSVSSKIKNLLDALKNDFQQINAGGLSAQFARCESIEVNQSNIFGAADYTANFISYPNELSDFNIRVLNPTDNRQISENRDGTISITRQISAQGISPNAIENARSFINSVQPDKNTVPPILLQIGNITNPGGGLKPRRMIETINRIDGTVSLDIEFLYRSNAPNNNIILNNSIDISYDEKIGIYNVSVQGSLSTGDVTEGAGSNWNTIKAELKSALGRINLFNLAFARLKDLTGALFLNQEPESFSITEDSLNSSLNFNYTFVSDPYDVKSDISYEINYDRLKDITTVSVNGNLTARGPQKDKKQKLRDAYDKLNLFNLANNFFEKNAESKSVKLNSNAINSTVTYNQYEDTIISLSFSSEFSNQFEEAPGLIKFEYTLSVTPSIDVYYPIQFLNGDNGVFDMNFYKRGTIGIDGSAIGKSALLGDQIRSLAENKLSEVINSLGASTRVRIEDNVSTPLKSDNGFGYTFSIKENCETNKFIT